jgi:biotin carboxylase
MKHLAFVDANYTSLNAVAYAKEQGYRTTFIYSSVKRRHPDTPGNRAIIAGAHKSICIDAPLDKDNVHEALSAVHAEHPVDAVIALFEFTVEPAGDASEMLGLTFVPTPKVARICRNKGSVRKILDDHGITSSRHRVCVTSDEIRAATEYVGYPCILKPVNGHSSVLAFRLDGPDALDHAIAQVDNAQLNPTSEDAAVSKRGMLVEEYLVGPMVSVEIGVRGDDMRIYMITGRKRIGGAELLDWGVDMPAWLDDEQWTACEVYAREIVKAIGLDDGVFHIEMIVTENGPRLVEANSRLMGGNLPLVYSNLTGSVIYGDLFAYFLGSELAPLPDPRGFGYSSSIRLETAEAGVWKSDGYQALYDTLSPEEATVIEVDQEIRKGLEVAAGRVIGRVQLFDPDLATLQSRIIAFVASVEDVGGIRVYKD